MFYAMIDSASAYRADQLLIDIIKVVILSYAVVACLAYVLIMSGGKRLDSQQNSSLFFYDDL